MIFCQDGKWSASTPTCSSKYRLASVIELHWKPHFFTTDSIARVRSYSRKVSRLSVLPRIISLLLTVSFSYQYFTLILTVWIIFFQCLHKPHVSSSGEKKSHILGPGPTDILPLRSSWYDELFLTNSQSSSGWLNNSWVPTRRAYVKNKNKSSYQVDHLSFCNIHEFEMMSSYCKGKHVR